MHSHHARCGHAEGPLSDFVAAASAQQLSIFGVSDHAPLFAHEADHPNPGIQMARSEFDAYLDEATDLKRDHADTIEVLTGTEADWIPGTEEVYRKWLSDSRLDHVLGSVHAFDEYHVYQPASWQGTEEPYEIYRRYFDAVAASAESGLFDIIAHMDAIKAMGPETGESWWPLCLRAIEAIADNDVAVEINTSGIRKCGEIFPSPRAVSELHRRGVPLTFGSDCHRTGEIGHGWAEVAKVLAQLGVSELASFRGRERRMVPLEAP